MENMGGICMENGDCKIIHTISPMVYAIYFIMDGKYIDEIKLFMFNSFEIIAVFGSMYLSMFSSIICKI